MASEFLVGGTVKGKGRQRRGAQPAELPPKVGVRFIAVMVLFGAAFTAAGAWQVRNVFEERDYEMEASRLQQELQARRDRNKVLMARVSKLQRADFLKEAAHSNLGMMEPPPEAIEEMAIPAEVESRWKRAAAASANSEGKEEVK